MSWPATWDRGSVLGAIEEASGVSLSADDSLPDTLIAKAQELGLIPVDLKLWIYDSPEHGWTPDALESWARRWLKARDDEPPRQTQSARGHCGAAIEDPAHPEKHQCQPKGEDQQ
jgi:hypothetical protein